MKLRHDYNDVWDFSDFSVATLDVHPRNSRATMGCLIRSALPLAGPSRYVSQCRTIKTSATWQAAVKRRPIKQAAQATPAAPAPRHPSLGRATATESPATQVHEKARTPPLLSTWAWRPVINPSRPDVVEEERTLFARPFELGRPRMYWFGFLASGLFFTAWILGPPPARSLPPREGET